MRTLSNFILSILVLSIAASCGDGSNQSTSVEQESNQVSEIKPLVKVTGEEVVYSTDSVDMKGYISYDSNLEGKRPGILVIHEWWGHTDYVRKLADM